MATAPFRSRRPPVAVVAVATLTVVFLAVPLVGLLAQASWGTLWHDLTTPVAIDALELSLICSLWATGLSVVFGVPLAWVLARTHLPGRNLVRALAILPMVLPPVVGGVALLLAFGRDGLLGRPLHDWFGVQLTFSTAGAVLAETFVAMPFVKRGIRNPTIESLWKIASGLETVPSEILADAESQMSSVKTFKI